MSNPSGNNDLVFNPQPQQGDVGMQEALAKQAPISGAPQTPAMPVRTPPQRSSPQFPVATPTPPAASYYRTVADQWTAIAKLKGASPLVKRLAKQANEYAAKVESGEV